MFPFLSVVLAEGTEMLSMDVNSLTLDTCKEGCQLV